MSDDPNNYGYDYTSSPPPEQLGTDYTWSSTEQSGDTPEQLGYTSGTDQFFKLVGSGPDWQSLGQGPSLAMGLNAGVATEANPGVAPGTGTIDRLVDWFNSKGDKAQGSILAIGGALISGMFSYKTNERKTRAYEKSSEAAMMNAETNAAALASKNDQLAKSQISRTNFGEKPTGLLYQPVKLNRPRSGV